LVISYPSTFSATFTSTGVPNQLYCRIVSLGVQHAVLSSITDSCFSNFPWQIYTFPFKETMGMLLVTTAIEGKFCIIWWLTISVFCNRIPYCSITHNTGLLICVLVWMISIAFVAVPILLIYMPSERNTVSTR